MRKSARERQKRNRQIQKAKLDERKKYAEIENTEKRIYQKIGREGQRASFSIFLSILVYFCLSLYPSYHLYRERERENREKVNRDRGYKDRRYRAKGYRDRRYKDRRYSEKGYR
jgi:hypothetical protein